MINLIKTFYVRKLIRDEGFRVSPESLDGINRAVQDLIKGMLNRVKEDGMKTLQPQHTGATQTTQESKSKCTKCANIRPEFLKFARNTQSWCVDEAIVMQKRIR